MRFKSWLDYQKFMIKYCPCSCFNCIGFVYSSDNFTGSFICMKTLSPVNTGIMSICAEWEDKNGKQLSDVKSDDIDEFIEYWKSLD